MNLPRYEITSDENAYMYHFISEGNKGKIDNYFFYFPFISLTNENAYMYHFISEGNKGKIEKVVIYEEMEIEGFFNLGFGDRNPITGYLDDEITTDNGDTEKVLATLYRFTDQFRALARGVLG